MQTILQSVGGELSNLVDVTVFLVKMSDYAAFNEASTRLIVGV